MSRFVLESDDPADVDPADVPVPDIDDPNLDDGGAPVAFPGAE